MGIHMASTSGARIGVAAGTNYSCCGAQSSGHRSTLKQLTRIGCYQVERTIGRGNFAVVKLATHTVTKNKASCLVVTIVSRKHRGSFVSWKGKGCGDREMEWAIEGIMWKEVAIKVIDKLKLDDDNREKIQREIKIIKLLQHPHIVRLYEVIETEDLICLVTEYASGGEMFDHLVRNGRLKEKEARAAFRQLLAAVAYCHTNNVVHRDLKAENVLLDSDLNVKVADFGFGNMCRRNEFLQTHCGSPPYAAPELFEGREYEGQKADIWSLGVVLFVLVCAKLPFDDGDLLSLRSRILRGRFQVPFYVSTDCEDLIRRMICVNPSKRIGIREILDHRWMKQSDNAAAAGGEDVEFRTLMERSLDTNQVQDEPLNEEVLNHMVAAGMDPELIRRSVTGRRFDSISAIYNLLVDGYIKKRRPAPVKSVSDITSSSSSNNNNNNGCSGETRVDASTDKQRQHKPTIVVSSSSAATQTQEEATTNNVSPVRYKRNHRHRHPLVLPGPEILEEYEQKSLKGARRLSTVVKETSGRQHRAHHMPTAFDRNRRASDGVVSLARFSGHLEKVYHQNLPDGGASQQVGGRSAEPSCSNLVEQLNQEYQLLQRQTGLYDLQQINDKYHHRQQQQQQSHTHTPMFTTSGFQTRPVDASNEAQPVTAADLTQTNNSLHWQLEQLNLQFGGHSSTTAVITTASQSVGLCSTLLPTSTNYQCFQQQPYTSGFASSTCTSANKSLCVPTNPVPSYPRLSLPSSGLPLPSQPVFRCGGPSSTGVEVAHLAGLPFPTFNSAASAIPIPQIGAAFPFPAARETPDATAFASAGSHRRCTTVMPAIPSGTSRHPQFQMNNQAAYNLPTQFRLQLENADRQRRCSLPVMLHSIAENVQLLAAGRRDDYDVTSSRKSSAATSGYATACASVAASRKTSCTSERGEVANLVSEDDFGAANADDDVTTSSTASSSSSSMSSSSDEQQEMQVDDQETTLQPEAVVGIQFPGVTAATYYQSDRTTPGFSAGGIGDGSLRSTTCGQQPEVSRSATTSGDGPIVRDTNRTLFELRGEVLATLDANVVSGKLSYWRHADNNLFVIRHTYVTVGLELRPVDGLPPFGRMLFRQIDGDRYCYVQLCNELITRILINSSSSS